MKSISNPLINCGSNINPVEFHGIRMQADLNGFTLSPRQWIEEVAAIGIISKAGRYGGTNQLPVSHENWVY